MTLLVGNKLECQFRDQSIHTCSVYICNGMSISVVQILFWKDMTVYTTGLGFAEKQYT